MAQRTSTSEQLQAGHFHNEVQIVAVFAGWRSFATPTGRYRAGVGDIAVTPSQMFHSPRMSDKSMVDVQQPITVDLTADISSIRRGADIRCHRARA
jgi:hypothetical protein